MCHPLVRVVIVRTIATLSGKRLHKLMLMRLLAVVVVVINPDTSFLCLSYASSSSCGMLSLFRLQHVREIVRGLGPEGIVGIFYCIALNPDLWTRGMPDLILWADRKEVDPNADVGEDTAFETPQEENVTMDGDDEGKDDLGDEVGRRASREVNDASCIGVRRGKFSDPFRGSEKDILLDLQVVVKLVEVKSENDHLSRFQKAWINALNVMQIPAVQLNVSNRPT